MTFSVHYPDLFFLLFSGTTYCEMKPSCVVPCSKYPSSVLLQVSGVRNVLTKAKVAGVLRLVSHDAGTFEIGDN
jgi:hypothetical protein